jgi:hypothetical protein
VLKNGECSCGNKIPRADPRLKRTCLLIPITMALLSQFADTVIKQQVVEKLGVGAQLGLDGAVRCLPSFSHAATGSP